MRKDTPHQWHITLDIRDARVCSYKFLGVAETLQIKKKLMGTEKNFEIS